MKTWMESKRIHEILSEERMRHDIPGISAAYRYVTPAMRAELIDAMSEAWTEALDARLEMSPRSPVAVLGEFLDERASARRLHLVKLCRHLSQARFCPMIGVSGDAAEGSYGL